MNDPGLDEPIQDAEETTREGANEWAREAEEEDLLLDPSRWWFASTASPLIAGTFGPMASAFNICALVEYWREYIPGNTLEDAGTYIRDPPWLLAVNAISLACAVVGNGSLLLNMVGRLRFEYAQPITIAGFLMAAFLLIALIAVASSPIFQLEPQGEHALTQAFYFACWAAGLYTIIGILMTITVYGALAGKYPKHFEINHSQRTLMLQTISFMAYLLVGATIYHKIEGWQFLDAVFWADFTLLTIGFGVPLAPQTHAGQALIIPYTFGGILAVGLVIGSIRSMLLEKSGQKMHARTTEKKRQQVITIKDAEMVNSRTSWWHKSCHLDKSKPTHHRSERDHRREEFRAMRDILCRAEREQRYTALAFSTLAAALLWFIGALIFYNTEYKQDWSYFQALYFSYVSLITLGYGDLQPQSNSGKAFFVFWSLLAVPTLTVLISDMGNTVIRGVVEATDYVGSLTILTGDKDFWEELRTNINALSGGRLYKSARDAEANKRRQAIMRRVKQDEQRLGSFPDLLHARLTEQEHHAITDYHSYVTDDSDDNEQQASDHERDTVFYHFLLVKEIRAVLADSQSATNRTYTYDEWAYFLKLLGQDENSSDYHTRQYNKPKRDSEEAPQVGRIVDHKGNAKQWSWLSLRSPLLSQMSEPEWILHRLLEKLHGEMHLQRKTGKSVGEVRKVSLAVGGQGVAIGSTDEDGPPIKLRRLLKTWSGKGSPEENQGEENGQRGEEELEGDYDNGRTTGKRSATWNRDDGEVTRSSTESDLERGRGTTRQRRAMNGSESDSTIGSASGLKGLEKVEESLPLTAAES